MSLFGKKTTPKEELSLGESLLNKEGASNKVGLIGLFDETKMARYKLAMEKKAIIFDKEDKHGVDYAHMDFVLSTGCNFHKGMTNLTAIQLFWKGFYPYLKKVTDGYQTFYDQFRSMIDDQEEVLSKHAELDFRHKWAIHFMKENCDKAVYKEFKKFIHDKVEQARAANPAPEKRAVDELPEVKQ